MTPCDASSRRIRKLASGGALVLTTLMAQAVVAAPSRVQSHTVPTPTPAVQTFAAVPAAGDPGDAFAVVEDAVYAPPAPPAPPPKPVPEWRVPADTSLRQVLTTWGRQEGWEVYWPKVDETTDWLTVVEVSFRAKDFEEAVRKFAAGLPPEVGIALTFNRANNPKLLHVSEATRRQTVITDVKAEN